MADKKSRHITEEDLFGSIPKPLDINPFEGIDMDEISAHGPQPAPPLPVPEPEAEIDPDIQPLNALDGIDMDFISAAPDTPLSASRTAAKPRLYEPINPIEGIDLDYVAVAPQAAVPQPSPQDLDPRAKFPKILRGRTDRRQIKPNIDPKLKSSYKYAEVQRLRESILNATAHRGSRTVAFVSPHDGVGATFLTTTIGLNAAAYCSMKVLLLDLNMRKPDLHNRFGVTREDGFGDIIQGDIRWKAVIHFTELDNLHIITAGAPIQDLANFLDRKFLLTMIEALKSVYDLVLCDTSPLLIQNRNNIDPGLVGSICDLTALVVHNNATTKTQLKDAVNAIQKGGGHLDGVILNEWS